MIFEYKLICNDYTVCPEDWGMQNEAATFHRVYYVTGGEAWCRCRDKEFRLQPETLYLFPVLLPYTLRHNPEDPLQVLWFHVETEEPLCTAVQAVPIERDSVLYHLLHSVRCLTGQPACFQDLTECVGIFLHILSRRLVMETMVSRQMRTVVEYVEQNAGSTGLNVDVLANLAGMDRASFSRKFKRIFNLSPGQFIYEKKMNCAARALTDGATVSEAAILAGYLDEKSFSRAFKRYTESSPSEYRKRRAILP